jgi:hypothetical protein
MAIVIDTDILQSFAARFIQDLRESMDSSGVTASGKFNRSLKAEIKPDQLVVTGLRYAGAIELGRKPTSGGGNGELRQAIRSWIDDKGITPTGKISKDSLAYIITRKIHREGTKLYRGTDYYGRSAPSRVISGVIEDGRIEKLAKSVVLDVISKFRTEIFKG